MSGADTSRFMRIARITAFVIVGSSAGAMLLSGGCLVNETCYSNADCQEPRICTKAGTCVLECETEAQCGESMTCEGNRCVPKPGRRPITCPEDMVNVAEAFCVDRYEASRPDATDASMGQEDGAAQSTKGVLPWQLLPPDDNETARDACLAAGKDLCTPQQWQAACEGSARTAYGYGDVYQPQTCNGIDTFGLDGFQLLPTGTLPGCRSEWGAIDINGNLWEHTLGGDDTTIRGGAYNCKDSQALHRCDYIPGNWTPSARGFRCCLVPSDIPDAGAQDAAQPDVSSDVVTDVESGCLDDAGSWDAMDAAEASDAQDGSVDQDAAQDVATDAPPDVGTDASSAGCPADMVRISDFCMDVYEASHADATAVAQGLLPIASSRKGVLPWFPVDLDTARNACAASDKRLCRIDEWVEGCSGPSGTVYGYGNDYDPVMCNGIDTYCDCSGSACGGLATCPYPHCFNQASTQGGGPCGSTFRVEPTGAFVACVSAHGVVDINGNVWELADSNDGLEHFRGGAYNCTDSEALHRCDHDGTWGPSARGFRCCKDPQ